MSTEKTTFTIGAGPVDPYPAVREAFSRPVLLDSDPQFLTFYERVNEKVVAPCPNGVRLPPRGGSHGAVALAQG